MDSYRTWPNFPTPEESSPSSLISSPDSSPTSLANRIVSLVHVPPHCSAILALSIKWPNRSDQNFCIFGKILSGLFRPENRPPFDLIQIFWSDQSYAKMFYVPFNNLIALTVLMESAQGGIDIGSFNHLVDFSFTTLRQSEQDLSMTKWS